MSKLRVRDLMTANVFSVLPEDQLIFLRTLMEGWEVRHAPVVDEDNTLLGIVTQRDLLRQTLLNRRNVTERELERNLTGLRVQDVMTANVETVDPETDAAEAARRMFDNKYGCLPVVGKDRRLLGMLTEADFVRYFAERRHETGSKKKPRPATTRKGR